MPDSASFRALDQGEDGLTFEQYTLARVEAQGLTETQARALFRRVWAFIQEYDHLRHEMQQEGHYEPPTVEQYAERWRMPVRNAYREFEQFRSLFPGATPLAVCDELWEGIGKQGVGGLMPLAAVKVGEPRWP